MKYQNKFERLGGNKDEWYTPAEAVLPILEYIVGGARILCPFDKSESEFVKILSSRGYKIEHSHISEGKDFFELEKPDVDYIISNPPFSKRDAILTRLYEWQIPFAMIFNVNGLFDSRNRYYLAQKYGAETMFLYPRVKFIDQNGYKNAPPFQSCYWCYKVLPEKMMFGNVDESLGENYEYKRN